MLGGNCGFDFNQLLSGNEEKPSSRTLPRQVECFEKSVIEQALSAHKGSIKGSMGQLGIPRKTLYDKMQKYGLDKSDFKE